MKHLALYYHLLFESSNDTSVSLGEEVIPISYVESGISFQPLKMLFWAPEHAKSYTHAIMCIVNISSLTLF